MYPDDDDLPAEPGEHVWPTPRKRREGPWDEREDENDGDD